MLSLPIVLAHHQQLGQVGDQQLDVLLYGAFFGELGNPLDQGHRLRPHWGQNVDVLIVTELVL